MSNLKGIFSGKEKDFKYNESCVTEASTRPEMINCVKLFA